MTTSMSVRDVPVPTHYVGAMGAALGASTGFLVSAMLAGLVFPRDFPHRTAWTTAAILAGTAAGVMSFTPRKQWLGALLGTAAGFGAVTGIALAPGPQAWWLRLPAMASAVPLGAFAGAAVHGARVRTSADLHRELYGTDEHPMSPDHPRWHTEGARFPDTSTVYPSRGSWPPA